MTNFHSVTTNYRHFSADNPRLYYHNGVNY